MSEELKPVAWRYRRSTFESDGSYGPWAITNNPETAKNMRALAPEFEVQALYTDQPSAPKPLAAEDVLRAGGVISYLGVTFDSLTQLNAAIAAKEPRNG